MIYQCFFREEHRGRLFQKPLYQGFGLEPEVNPNITRKCPELENPLHRTHLCAYGAMLHLWRNPPDDGHNWIGFTSYRQFDKSPIVFRSNKWIENILKKYKMIAWLYLDFDSSLAEDAEQCHPGIMEYIREILKNDTRVLETRKGDFFAEYWIMRKEVFNQYMTWQYPFIAEGLGKIGQHPYLSAPNNRSPLGFVLERLYIYWRHQFEIQTYDYTYHRLNRLRRLMVRGANFLGM